MKLLPSLLYPDFEQFSARFHECVDLGRGAHVDFADGEFVPSRLPSIDRVSTLPGEIELEAHFMVQKPTGWVESALKDDRFKTLIIHAESDANMPELILEIKKAGRKVGLALKPSTTVNQVAPYLKLIDQVLVLFVDPGFNGSPFIPEMLDKARELHARYPKLIVEADGAMNPESLPLVRSAGASQAAIGSYLHDKNLAESLAELAVLVEKDDA